MPKAMPDEHALVAAGRDLPYLSALFQDTDGDGVGDLKGIELRLDYLAGLGVDAMDLADLLLADGRFRLRRG
jgi:hypothetical protein